MGLLDKNRLALLSFVCLSLLLSGCAGVGQNPQTWRGSLEWVSIGWLAIAAMGSLLALSYMASVALQDEQMRAWTKRELAQLAFSAFILVCLIALTASIDGWLKVLSVSFASQPWQEYVNKIVCCEPSAGSACVDTPALAGERPCHIALAQDYLQILFESGRMTSNTMLQDYYIPAMLSQLHISAPMPVMPDIITANYKPFPHRQIDAQFYNQVFDLAFKTTLFVRVQQIFLDYMWGALVPLMLGLGIALRAFHFSRKLGGMLIALGLAVYIVLPMLYVLLSGILFGFMGGWTSASGEHALFGSSYDTSSLPVPSNLVIDLEPKAQSEMFGKGMNFMNVCLANAEEREDAQGLWEFIVKLSWEIIKSGLGVLGEVVTGGNIAGQLVGDPETISRFSTDGPLSSLGMLLVFTLVTPFISLMTTLAAFKYLSPLIGGDVELSLISRLI